MALGGQAIDGGAAPHKLRQGIDKGVLVVAGDGIKLAPGQPSITVRTHYIDDDDANEVADRIRARRSGVTIKAAADPTQVVDHLADVATVVGAEARVRSQEVLHRLAVLNPDAYRDWGFGDLKAALEPDGAGPYYSNGMSTIARDRVLEGIANRNQNAADNQ